MVRNEVTDFAVLKHYDSIHCNVNQAEREGEKLTHVIVDYRIINTLITCINMYRSV